MKLKNEDGRKIWRLVLTGGPCGGKTTGQERISTFFENLGWKVYRAPETATVLLGGGVKFGDLTPEAAINFQENLLKTMLQIENSFFELAETSKKNCLVICDRGSMDASAFVAKEQWDTILAKNGLNEVDIRDNRYNQVVHIVSAAKGAEEFYTTENHAVRRETVEEARVQDSKAAEAWVGHPYVDVIDNRADFETKMRRLIKIVAQRIGIDLGDMIKTSSKKVKFVVHSPLPDIALFPNFRDFEVIHHFLGTASVKIQSRLRKRGRKGKWSYTHTTVERKEKQVIEVKASLTYRDYSLLLANTDDNHLAVNKVRRCFLYKDKYFQLDIYKNPSLPRCDGLMLLQTWTTTQLGNDQLPGFLDVGDEVTGDSAFSMFNLSLRKDWIENNRFNRMLSMDETEEEVREAVLEAVHRLKESVPLPKSMDLLNSTF